MKPAWVAVVLGGVIVALLVLLYGPMPEHPPAIADAGRDDRPIAEALRGLDERLARIESSLAVRDSRGSRETAVPSASPPAADVTPAVDLRRELQQMSDRIDLLAKSIKENHKPAFSVPTLEQIHAARRDVDWAYVDQLRQIV